MYKTHGSGGGTSAILLHILKNNSALINTIDKFKAWCESISGQVIVSCNGTIKYNNVFYPCYAILKRSNNQYDLYYIDATTGSTQIANVNLNDYFTDVTDDVNKIN